MKKLAQKCCLLLGLCLVPSLLWGNENDKCVQSYFVGYEGGVQDLGYTYSFSLAKSSNFHTINLFLDTQGLFLGKKSGVGGMLRYYYNFPILDEGRMFLYTGAGGCTGYVNDVESTHGFVFGLCANLGFQYRLGRNFAMGVHIHPTLGYKLDNEEGNWKLRTYLAGLWRSILPNISINYHFRTPKNEMPPYLEKRFTFGVEASYNPTIYTSFQQMYFASEGDRYHSEKSGFDYFSNGELFAHASYWISERARVGMLFGYAGIRHDIRLLEYNVRGVWYFKPLNPAGDRFFVNLDAGIGAQTRDMTHPFAIGKLGIGYHVKIGPTSCMELFIRSAHHYGSPLLYDETGTEVQSDKVLRSDLYINNLSFGISLGI